MLPLCLLRLMFRAVDIQLRQILFPFADRGRYTVLMIDICAGYNFALLIAVDIPHWSARPCRPAVLSLSFVIAVDIYSCARYAFASLIAIDIPRC